MGGSYGGYMTALLLGRTDRFAGRDRASGRSPTRSASSGPRDIGFFFPDQYLGTDPERIAAQSAAGVRATGSPRRPWSSTPRRTGAARSSRAPRLYVELKRRGVPTELLLFPGEGHELCRSGRPSHRLARFDAILDWWSRHFA